MSAFFSNLIFLNPWLLVALAAMPALWFLLRLMPPAPKRIFLPSAAFLEGLIPEQKTPSHTPWWILLLRLLLAGLVILAFAQPVLNPSDTLSGNNRIRLLIDNDWAAGSLWDTQMDSAKDLLAQAERAGHEVLIATTAPAAGQDKPALFGPLSANEAEAVLGGLSPLPWPSDYNALTTLIKEQEGKADTYWLSHGLQERGFEDLLDAVQAQGAVKLFTPAREELPLALHFDEGLPSADSVALEVPGGVPEGLPVTLQALGENGRVLGLQSVALTPGTRGASVALDIPEVLRKDIRQIKIAERQSAGSVLMLGDLFARKSVGIVTPLQDSEATPFIEASYYLTRALEPYADIRTGRVDDILNESVSMMILPDIGSLVPSELNRLEDWVRQGGLLLRFAGPNMASEQSDNFLIPVPVRSGMRAMDGALTWDNPPKLAAFSEGSPFYGLNLHEDITVRQQLLAQPSVDLAEKTWASLDDGTPLVTASSLDDGSLVMVHTTASPDWSDFPLSGMFVQMLSRLVKLAGSAPDTIKNVSGTLQPLVVLDGFGRIQDPDSTVQTVAAVDFADLSASSSYPPGVYGRGNIGEVLNLGPQVGTLKSFEDLPVTLNVQTYGESYEMAMMPALLKAAFTLLILDWLVMLLLSLNLTFKQRGFTALLLICSVLTFGSSAHADIITDAQYADGLYLAYFKSPDAATNTLVEAGLGMLVENLNRRTSAEPEGVVGLSPESGTLNFFPLIYWPIAAGDPAPSEAALANIQSYLDHGGTILIDTRSPENDTRFLANAIGALNIPAMTPIPDDHVLGRSFYLLESFPGRYQGGTLWVEATSASGRDGVSSVIIGSHDWAGAWADSGGRYYRSGAGTRQREMATRFGVNLVMYALTGNYKADQVHVESILERLGQ